MFKAFDPKKTIKEAEEEVLQFWRDRKIFEQSVKQREGQEQFVVYEGPPTANAQPKVHHVMVRTFKDIIGRYQTMKGKYVLRQAGWDTHGLPVELQVEKALGLNNKADIERYGVAEFNKRCQELVWQYKEEWERLTLRMGYWTDLEHPYITYEPDYIESVWWGLKQLWEKGLIYKDYKVVPYCPRCGTALSFAEVAQGYKDVTETSVYLKFPLVDSPNTYILAWTTTPWTLPGNVALAVNPDLTYVAVKQGNETYYLAKARLSILKGEYKILKELPGSALSGKTYKPLFEFLDLAKESGQEAYRILTADFVTAEDGTGIVHTAVMYGEDDFLLGKKADLPMVHTVNEQGQFNKLVPNWQGQFVKKAEPDIVNYLDTHGLLYRTEETTHTYPFCWRCDTPLLYYARDSWFIRIDQATRERLVELNEGIDWVPSHIKNGRFGKWLEGLRDWAISRERYWGTPLPIWVCENDRAHQICVGSFSELEANKIQDSICQGLALGAAIAAHSASDSSTAKLADQTLDTNFDPHKPFIDEVILRCPQCAGSMRRVPEVIDVWLDSGSMPYAQWHYPFSNREKFEQQFPADFIAEAVDQTRGWFNSLLVLSTLIFDKASYRSVICGGHLLDEKGQKMSKSKGNVVDPWDVIEQTGIDALRFYMVSVNQPGDSKNFSTSAVAEVYKKTILIWWNVVNFFLTYSTLDNWQSGERGSVTTLDSWITSRLAQVTAIVDQSLNRLDTFTAARALTDFVDDLSTWYLRRSRKRRDAAFYATLHHVLIEMAKLFAPLTPFVAEATYQALKTEAMPESVHLTNFPTPTPVDSNLIASMAMVRLLVTAGHAARAEAGIKLRQPLSKALIVDSSVSLSNELRTLLADELNVKEVSFASPDSNEWLESKDRWLVIKQGELIIALDPVITPELKSLGLYRELIREFQEVRKKAGCRPGQLVSFSYETDNLDLQDIIESRKTELLEEVSGKELRKKTELNFDSKIAIPGRLGHGGALKARSMAALGVQASDRASERNKDTAGVSPGKLYYQANLVIDSNPIWVGLRYDD